MNVHLTKYTETLVVSGSQAVSLGLLQQCTMQVSSFNPIIDVTSIPHHNKLQTNLFKMKFCENEMILGFNSTFSLYCKILYYRFCFRNEFCCSQPVVSVGLDWTVHDCFLSLDGSNASGRGRGAIERNAGKMSGKFLKY